MACSRLSHSSAPPLAYASSVGAYEPGPTNRAVDELAHHWQGLVRAAARAAWKLRLQPTSPGWLDMGMLSPIMDITPGSDGEPDTDPG